MSEIERMLAWFRVYRRSRDAMHMAVTSRPGGNDRICIAYDDEALSYQRYFAVSMRAESRITNDAMAANIARLYWRSVKTNRKVAAEYA